MVYSKKKMRNQQKILQTRASYAYGQGSSEIKGVPWAKGQEMAA